MGDTNFYVVFIPFLYWVIVPLRVGVDANFVHVFSSMLFFMALIAGVLKDIMNSPRPPRDKIWRLKDEHDNGFPSSHSQNAMGLSIYVAHTFWNDFGEYRYIIAGLLALYTTLVAMSRFYNGVHSLPDIIAGLFAGIPPRATLNHWCP
jgi:membrane-associated phospholipid phosphatase